MTLTSLSVIMAVVVTNLYHKGLKMRPAPRWLDTILIKWFARFVLVTDDIEVFTQFVELVREPHTYYRQCSACRIGCMIVVDLSL